MNQLTQLFIAVFLLGASLGAVGYRVAEQQLAAREPTTTSRESDGLVAQSIPEEGLSLRVRPTDQLIRMQGADTTIVGARVFDSFSGDPQSAPHVDLIWQRQTDGYDLPDATSLEAYQAAVEGLTIHEARELTVAGRPAIKQLYTATINVPGPLGSTRQQTIPNLLRYVIERDAGNFLIIRSATANQPFLDFIVQHLSFTGKQAVLPAATTDSHPIPSIETGADIDISGVSITPQSNSSANTNSSNPPTSIPIR